MQSQATDTIDVQAVAPSGAPCAACGTPIEAHERFCPGCGLQVPSPKSKVQRSHAQHFRCQQCGAEVATEEGQRSYVCPFCDSTYVQEFSRDDSDRQPPEFVIGFAVTPEQAQEGFRQWLRERSFFRPGDLAVASVADKLRGVYLPFWSFAMLAESRWHAQIGEHWYRTETYTTTDSKGRITTHTRQVQETEWWPLGGRHHRYYSGYLVSGSKGLAQEQSLRIGPFNLPALKRYEPFYLAGWLAEEYSVERAEALAICEQEFQRQEQANVAAFMPGDTHHGLTVATQFSSVTSDLCLLPIYILSYRYRDRVYRFLLNGQTGKRAGDKPLSAVRIGSAIALTVALLMLLVLFLVLVQRPWSRVQSPPPRNELPAEAPLAP